MLENVITAVRTGEKLFLVVLRRRIQFPSFPVRKSTNKQRHRISDSVAQPTPTASGICSFPVKNCQHVSSCCRGNKTTLPTMARERPPVRLRHYFSKPMTAPGGSEASAVRRQSGFFSFLFFFFRRSRAGAASGGAILEGTKLRRQQVTQINPWTPSFSKS